MFYNTVVFGPILVYGSYKKNLFLINASHYVAFCLNTCAIMTVIISLYLRLKNVPYSTKQNVIVQVAYSTLVSYQLMT